MAHRNLSQSHKKRPRLLFRTLILLFLTVTPVFSWIIWKGGHGGRSMDLETLPKEDKERLGELVLRVSSNPDNFEFVYRDFWGILQKNGPLSPSGTALLREKMRGLFYLPKLFWEDARQTVREKRPIKSVERDNLEKKFLKEGFLPQWRITADEETMEELANDTPIEAEHGVEVLVDEAMVQEILDTWNEDEIKQIIEKLFLPPD